MSLKKKIALSFIISAAIIAILATFEYMNVVQIGKEIRFLELTDTVRSKSLQLRRHEKNFFLYSPTKSAEESSAIHRYLDDLETILAGPIPNARSQALGSLRERVREYRNGFDAVESLLTDLSAALRAIGRSRQDRAEFFPLIEAAIYERPLQAAESLRTVFHLPSGHRLVTGLKELDVKINALRKNGEDIIATSKELDRAAREKAENGIRMSQLAILVVFPVFLATGIALLFLISRNVVSRLRLLTDVVERTGKGEFGHVAVTPDKLGNDEVGILIRKFDHMEDQLADRETELERKNTELLQSKKLAAIGTLAAGVAHELNNPLNNIYLSTQVLVREAGNDCPPEVKEVVTDILSQTVRVKKIVGDLLEFARGREPQKRDVTLTRLIRSAFSRLRLDAERVAFSLDSDPDETAVPVDPGQMEQVFINLFTNAVEAMSGRGELRVGILPDAYAVRIRVSDTGKGIPKEAIEKIYEPFFTTKQKGTGLGLAIVFNIIKKHGGDITVESEVGKGTTFEITLPKS